ncbi:hypothetical protein [Teredinibacter turnerae]|uniref:hypothetical protein n=1 Tax=Teredinibacter turnerae TaxID=2426 RepID=UPI00037EE14D|nr:hypothetical protein [Teredinibacter turnerae]
MTKLFLGPSLCLALSMATANAHESLSQLPATQMYLRGAMTYRDIAGDASARMIPGALLGGEATAPEKSLQLDDIQLVGHYLADDSYAISAKISGHEHNGDSNLTLENIWLTWGLNKSLIEIGRITTDITPTAYYHAGESAFNEASLLSDVFFGRHFNDVGVRVKSSLHSINAGIEGWRGGAWPSANNEGAASAFASWQPVFYNSQLTLKTWAMNATSVDRRDDRYTNAHTHGSTAIVSSAANIGFTGETQLFGAFASIEHNMIQTRVFAEFEWIVSKLNGTLADDNNQSSQIDAEYSGSRALLGVASQHHQWTVQFDNLILKNHFLTAINQQFLQQTGLMNNGTNPQKLMFAWQWNFHRDLSLRAQWQSEKLSEDTVEYGSLGIVWNTAINGARLRHR